jgi:hypothetical protein
MPNFKDFPLDIVGSTSFGRYSKISVEQTFNMIISDGWLVPYAGHLLQAQLASAGRGRAIYASGRYGHLIAVADNRVLTVGKNLSVNLIGIIDTSVGNVFINENNAGQIAICDQSNIYIFNTLDGTFKKVITDFIPGYIAFQDGYFIASSVGTSEWRLSDPNNGFSWPAGASNTGLLQTKPDEVQAVVRFPGKGNLLLVFGNTVTEMWYDTGTGLFPYQKNTFNNIDFGCLNAATIATNDNKVIWVASNEKSGPVIMLTDGNSTKKISDDGINFRLSELTKPQNCYGFCFDQDGHSFYQVTWPVDKFTLLMDFNTGKFFTLTDEYMSSHIARGVAFFNNKYYFVSDKDGGLYELNSDYETYNGAEIPRIRVCKKILLPDQSKFIIQSLQFTLEQGDSAETQRVDFSMSKDGGKSFGNSLGVNLNPLGNRRNRFLLNNLGWANDFVPQFRFWGKTKFVVTNGSVRVYQ